MCGFVCQTLTFRHGIAKIEGKRRTMPKSYRREDVSLKNGVLGDRITVRLTKDGMMIPEGVNDDDNPFVEGSDSQFKVKGWRSK